MSLFTFIIRDSDFNKRELKRIYNLLFIQNLKLNRIESKLDKLILDNSINKDLDKVINDLSSIINKVKTIV